MEECMAQIQVALWEGELLVGRMAEVALLLGAGEGGVEVEEEGKVEVEPEIEVIGAAGGSPTQTIQPMKVIMT
jgi:hypothetical protein